MLLQKERAINVSENKGPFMVPKSMEACVEGSHSGLLNYAEKMAHVQALKGELDKLTRLVGCGFEVGSKMFCCHKCGLSMDESLANGT